VARVLAAAVDLACERAHTTRASLARYCLYVSHETGTRLCATAELHALRAVFGTDVAHVCIANTKATTGHAMGAGIEDAVAVASLERQCAPAVDVSCLDEAFVDLTFSDGAPRRLDYAVHAAYGMGSHVAVAVYALVRPADGDEAEGRQVDTEVDADA